MSSADHRAPYTRAQSGERAEVAPASATPEARAWGLAARVLAARYGRPQATPGPDMPVLDALAQDVLAFAGASPEARHGAARAALEGLRWAALRFELTPMAPLVSALRAVVPADAEGQAHRAAAELWCALGRDDAEPLEPQAQALEAEASALGAADLVVEAAALRAWALAARGSLAEATKVARRASRMARTEGLPQTEYLAHWTLARVRRLAGAPHLALRILSSLRGVAPPAWAAVLAWEVVLSGGVAEGPGPAAALSAWVQGLERGEGAGHAARTEVLERAAAPWPAHRREVAAWLGAVDPALPPVSEVAAWAQGEVHTTPAALTGLLAWRGVAPAADSALAYVLVDGALRRRVPRLSFALIDTARVRPTEQSRLKQGRTEMLVAALALAPTDGVDEAACFARVYGFAYEPEVHKSIFDVLVHRTREHLAGQGTLVRGGGTLRLVLDRPLLAADPRCTRPLGEALLGVLAEQAGASAKDVAKATGVSLRVVQATLQSLVAEGACQQERGGREVRYLVEDTTYSEPTQRVRASWT